MIVWPLLILMNLALLPAGICLVVLSARSKVDASRTCVICGYDLRGTPGHSCPECGCAQHRAPRGRLTREGRALLALGLTLLAVPIAIDLAVAALLVATLSQMF